MPTKENTTYTGDTDLCVAIPIGGFESLFARDLSLSLDSPLRDTLPSFFSSSYGFLALVLHSGYTLKIRTATLTCLLVVDEWRMEF